MYLFTGRNSRTRTSSSWKDRSDHEGPCVATNDRVCIADGNQQSTLAQHDRTLHLSTGCMVVGDPVGYPVRKDMRYEAPRKTLEAAYAPNHVANEIEQRACFWKDWGDDIFDYWGHFYLFDVTTQQYTFLPLSPLNQEDFILTTQMFDAFGRTYTIVHGYIAQGIFKLEVFCPENSNPFIVGAYGDMGSDDATINTDMTAPYKKDGRDLTLFYNRNVEADDEIERFFVYVVPYSADKNTTKTYTKYSYDEDNLSIFSVPVVDGITLFFSKKNDVKEVVIDHLLRGMSSLQRLHVNGNSTFAGTIDADRIMVNGGEVVPTGTIVNFIGSVPTGWLPCDGGLYSSYEYPTLADRLQSYTGDEGDFQTPTVSSGSEGVVVMIKT